MTVEMYDNLWARRCGDLGGLSGEAKLEGGDSRLSDLKMFLYWVLINRKENSELQVPLFGVP
jgi:hypothetical protein